jgi:hypothetical protein
LAVVPELELDEELDVDVDDFERDSLLLPLDSLLALLESFELLPESESFLPESESFLPESAPLSDDDEPEPLAALVDDRESVMYQPLPLKTMPTG